MYQPLFHIFMWPPASLVFFNFIFHIFIIMWPPASRSHIFFNCCLARLVIDVILLNITTRTLGLRWWLMAQQKSVITQNWICIIQVESGNKYCIFFFSEIRIYNKDGFPRLKSMNTLFRIFCFSKMWNYNKDVFPRLKSLNALFRIFCFSCVVLAEMPQWRACRQVDLGWRLFDEQKSVKI